LYKFKGGVYMLKKVYSFITILLVIFLVKTVAIAKTYNDIGEQDYRIFVENLSEIGVISGYPDGTFRGEESITRAEFAKVIYNVLGIEGEAINEGEEVYSDIPENYWASKYIKKLRAKKIIRGYSDNTYRPNETISSAEAITMFVRAVGLESKVEKSGKWPSNYIEEAKEIGLIEEDIKDAKNVKINRGKVTALAFKTMSSNKWEYDSRRNKHIKMADTLLSEKYNKRVDSSGKVKEITEKARVDWEKYEKEKAKAKASRGSSSGGGSSLPPADNTPPVITLLPNNSKQVIEVGSAYTELGATATDAVDGNLTTSIVIDTSGLNVNVAGNNYFVEYKVKDKAGNESSKRRLVQVKAKESKDISKVLDDISVPYVANKIDLGIPELANRSTSDKLFSRNIWDMKTYKGKVYMGLGDYDRNKGPCNIHAYNSVTESIELTGQVYDEEVHKFVIIDGKLVAPSIDPKSAWSGYAGYYVTDGTGWEKKGVIKNNIHSYDFIKFDNTYFLAGATYLSGVYSSSIQSSTDGVNYSEAKLYVNNEEINYYYRTYELFVFKGKLYASSYNQLWSQTGLFMYDKNTKRFNKCTDKDFFFTSADLGSKSSTREDNLRAGRRIIFNDKTILIHKGNLQVSSDLVTYQEKLVGNNNNVRDIIIIDDKIVTLSGVVNPDGSYTTYVHTSKNAETFKEIFKFNAATYMKSFEYVDGSFIFGAGGSASATSTEVGRVYRVKLY